MHYRLTEEIIALSVSDQWDFAKLEWDFEYAYYSDEPQSCLCGHYPIRNICVLKNKVNLNTTEVGNCCVNKFLGIDDGNKIFSSIKKIKENAEGSVSLEVIEYLYRKKGISDFDYQFYKSIHRKRNLSAKQWEIKERINHKFLDFTSYETNIHFNKINQVLKWAESNHFFNTDFILSLKQSCQQIGRLTENQLSALDNIIQKISI